MAGQGTSRGESWRPEGGVAEAGVGDELRWQFAAGKTLQLGTQRRGCVCVCVVRHKLGCEVLGMGVRGFRAGHWRDKESHNGGCPGTRCCSSIVCAILQSSSSCRAAALHEAAARVLRGPCVADACVCVSGSGARTSSAHAWDITSAVIFAQEQHVRCVRCDFEPWLRLVGDAENLRSRTAVFPPFTSFNCPSVNHRGICM